MADASSIPKHYVYQISRNGGFLGVLQNVKSEFGYTQQINTAGTQIVIEVGDTPDHQFDAPEAILTETGEELTTEFGETLVTERAYDTVGNSNDQILVRNNNDIDVYEYSPNYPNGKLVFSGFISKWRAMWGSSDIVRITCLSKGADLDNYLILGSNSNDVSQTIYDQVWPLEEGGSSLYQRGGQSWTVGSGINNLAAVGIELYVNATTPETITVKVWNSVNEFSASGTPLGTASVTASRPVGYGEYTFTFPSAITVVGGSSYFFSVQGSLVANTGLAYQDTNAYASGEGWFSFYYGGGGGGWQNVSPQTGTASDLYFKTYYTSGATNTAYSSQDPGVIIQSIMDSYISRGGGVNYDGTSIWATGTSVSYTFQVNTVLEGIKKMLSISPSDFYWYVNPGTNLFYFQQTSTTADHVMIYGRHIESLELEASIEDVKTSVFFTGGNTGTDNLYLSASDVDALSANAGRVGLARITDNRVTDSPSGVIIEESYLDANSSERYITSISINDKTYDTNLFNLGDTVGFAGFGNLVDNLLLQIVQISKTPDSVTLGLGSLFRRASSTLEEVQRRLNELETVDNPTIPS